MRFPRPRFTVRRLMIAVAVVALGLGAFTWVFEMRARSASYRERALMFKWNSVPITGSWVFTEDGGGYDRYTDENRVIEFHWASRMSEKYRHLSCYPWLAVEPDPAVPRLAHPRSAREMGKVHETQTHPDGYLDLGLDPPPSWTFLWTR